MKGDKSVLETGRGLCEGEKESMQGTKLEIRAGTPREARTVTTPLGVREPRVQPGESKKDCFQRQKKMVYDSPSA